MNFLEAVRSQQAVPADVTNWTERWHNNEWPDLTLRECLGLTEQQYALFMQDSQYLCMFIGWIEFNRPWGSENDTTKNPSFRGLGLNVPGVVFFSAGDSASYLIGDMESNSMGGCGCCADSVPINAIIQRYRWTYFEEKA